MSSAPGVVAAEATWLATVQSKGANVWKRLLPLPSAGVKAFGEEGKEKAASRGPGRL
jgi:hypothetical protein